MDQLQVSSRLTLACVMILAAAEGAAAQTPPGRSQLGGPSPRDAQATAPRQ